MPRRPKKAIGIFSRSQSCAYQFIAQHRQDYPITVMCRVLEVSVSGYSAWRSREPSKHSREDAQLAEQVRGGFSGQSLRLWQSTGSCGTACAGDSLCMQMAGSSHARNLRLFAKRPGHRTVTTKSEKGAQVAPNLLQRDLRADQPNTKWVADTVYIWTAEGWLFLTVVPDVFSRMVVCLAYKYRFFWERRVRKEGQAVVIC